MATVGQGAILLGVLVFAVEVLGIDGPSVPGCLFAGGLCAIGALAVVVAVRLFSASTQG